MVDAWIGLLAAAVVATVSGCDSCYGTYNCPNMGSKSVFISVPTAVHSSLVSVTTSGRCRTNFTTDHGEGPVNVTATGAGTCAVNGKLADGTELETTLVFESVDLGCCGTGWRVSGSLTFESLDAGAP